VNFANNLFNLASKSSGFQENYLLCNGVPCISRLNLQMVSYLNHTQCHIRYEARGAQASCSQGAPNMTAGIQCSL